MVKSFDFNTFKKLCYRAKEVQYNLKLTCTFLFLDSSSTLPFPTGIVEEEWRKGRVAEQIAYKPEIVWHDLVGPSLGLIKNSNPSLVGIIEKTIDYLILHCVSISYRFSFRFFVTNIFIVAYLFKLCLPIGIFSITICFDQLFQNQNIIFLDEKYSNKNDLNYCLIWTVTFYKKKEV
ncbi:hypothetical protein BpHYR1_044869 [Brachionus plicatilis]|uniref:Uncharacterized protein n=1 Tax=Brachionus plicatilis TaxID=10195 RepID=A0A3M7R2S1_BRAPC|nr:hypothetical protein BpHYR1_044869 [Brachionus plicatilis]